MISIVIPLYNKAQSIKNTIRCIQAQTVQDFEVIVVEGWSTDGSLEIIKRLSEEDSRITVLMQQNRKGITPARNESILASHSDIIAFIDGDDVWKPTYLETLLKLVHDYPDAGIWGLTHGIQRDRDGSVNREQESISKLNGFRGIISNPWIIGNPYWTSATAISRKAFDAIGGFDNGIIYGEDIDLWYRLMLNFPAAFDGQTKPLAFYRVDAENRACNKTFNPSINIPFHIKKYSAYRTANKDFRKYFDREMLYRLFPYAGKKEYRKELRDALKYIDFSQQKLSFRLRFMFPNLYRRIKHIPCK